MSKTENCCTVFLVSEIMKIKVINGKAYNVVVAGINLVKILRIGKSLKTHNVNFTNT